MMCHGTTADQVFDIIFYGFMGVMMLLALTMGGAVAFMLWKDLLKK